MKLLLGFLLLIIFSFEAQSQSVSSFQANLGNIYEEFSRTIINKNNCTNLSNRAYQLRTDIEGALEDNNYTRREINQLQGISNESKAAHDYIRAVGDCSRGIVGAQDFYLVNQSVNSRIINVIKGDYCVDVISITINDFTSYLAVNNSNNNYTVSYSWNSSSSYNRGRGTMGLSSKSMRAVYTNRDEPSERDITVENISCQVF